MPLCYCTSWFQSDENEYYVWKILVFEIQQVWSPTDYHFYHTRSKMSEDCTLRSFLLIVMIKLAVNRSCSMFLKQLDKDHISCGNSVQCILFPLWNCPTLYSKHKAHHLFCESGWRNNAWCFFPSRRKTWPERSKRLTNARTASCVPFLSSFSTSADG